MTTTECLSAGNMQGAAMSTVLTDQGRINMTTAEYRELGAAAAAAGVSLAEAYESSREPSGRATKKKATRTAKEDPDNG